MITEIVRERSYCVQNVRSGLGGPVETEHSVDVDVPWMRGGQVRSVAAHSTVKLVVPCASAEDESCEIT